MACHTLHAYFKELGLGAPTTVYGRSSIRHRGFFQFVSTPECQSHANTVTWQFGARSLSEDPVVGPRASGFVTGKDGEAGDIAVYRRYSRTPTSRKTSRSKPGRVLRQAPMGDLPPLIVHWYDGGMKPHRPLELDTSVRLPETGLLFVGDQGKLLTGYSGGNPFGRSRGIAGGLLLPEKKFRDFEQPEKTMYRCNDHYGEWIRACKTGTRTVCPVEFGCEMTEMALLGTLALRTKRVLAWDAEVMRVTNHADSNKFVDPPYRDGWTL